MQISNYTCNKTQSQNQYFIRIVAKNETPSQEVSDPAPAQLKVLEAAARAPRTNISLDL